MNSEKYVPYEVVELIFNRIEKDGYATKGIAGSLLHNTKDAVSYSWPVKWPNLKHKIYEVTRFLNCHWPNCTSYLWPQSAPAMGNKLHLWKDVKKYLDEKIAPLCKSKWELKELL